MGLPQKRIAWISPDDYLRMEEASLTKHEYLDGVIYDWQGGGPKGMAGGSKAHNKISLNVALSLRQQLKGGPYSVFMADVRLRMAERNAYFYPDVMVSCGDDDHDRHDAVLEPSLIVEVLSISTEDFDRGDKFVSCRQFSTLQSYVLVDPPARSVEVFARSANWQPAVYEDGGDVSLACLDLRLSTADVFEGA